MVLVLSAATLTMLVSQHTASACVPVSLVVATAKAASVFAAGEAASAGAVSVKVAVLAKGTLKSMLLAKLKITSTILIILAATGLGVELDLESGSRPAADPSPAQIADAFMRASWHDADRVHIAWQAETTGVWREYDHWKAGAA